MKVNAYVVRAQNVESQSLDSMKEVQFRKWFIENERLNGPDKTFVGQKLEYGEEGYSMTANFGITQAVAGDLIIMGEGKNHWRPLPVGPGTEIECNRDRIRFDLEDLRNMKSYDMGLFDVWFDASVTFTNAHPDLYFQSPGKLEGVVTKVAQEGARYQITATPKTHNLPCNTMFILDIPVENFGNKMTFQSYRFDLDTLKYRFNRMDGIETTILLDDYSRDGVMLGSSKEIPIENSEIPSLLKDLHARDQQTMLITNEYPEVRDGQIYFPKAFEAIEKAGGKPFILDVETLLRL